jgi:hypothetical protein
VSPSSRTLVTRTARSRTPHYWTVLQKELCLAYSLSTDSHRHAHPPQPASSPPRALSSGKTAPAQAHGAASLSSLPIDFHVPHVRSEKERKDEMSDEKQPAKKKSQALRIFRNVVLNFSRENSCKSVLASLLHCKELRERASSIDQSTDPLLWFEGLDAWQQNIGHCSLLIAVIADCYLAFALSHHRMLE